MPDNDFPDAIAAIAEAIKNGSYEPLARVLAGGMGAVAIGGDASGADITTNVRIGETRFELNGDAVKALHEALERCLPAPLNNLPAVSANFVGRGAEEAKILAGLARGEGSQAISALRGIGGIGKTELAVRVARQLALHYPAAQILIDLQGTAATPLTPRAAI